MFSRCQLHSTASAADAGVVEVAAAVRAVDLGNNWAVIKTASQTSWIKLSHTSR